MFLFKKKIPQVLGIDITATSVKLLELERSGGGLRVMSHAVEPLAANSVSEKAINDVEAVGEGVSRALKKSRSKNKNASVAVSGSSVITKVITVSGSLSEYEMEEQIQVEADQYIPFPLEEVAIDFEVLGENKEDPDLVDVMLAAARLENVEKYVSVLDYAGLTAKIVDLEVFAVENAIAMMLGQQANGGDGQTVAVADIGSVVTTFTVLDNLRTVFSREQNFGGNQLTESIQRRYGLPYEEAKIVQREGGLPDNYKTEVLEPFIDSIAQQVNRAQQFFFSSSSIHSVDQLILSGGCASITDLAGFVEEKIGVPTTVGNPFQDMSVPSRLAPALSKDAPAMLVACGLALRSFG